MSGISVEGWEPELAPEGFIRLGLVEAPTPGVFFVQRETGTGRVRGVTADLGEELGRSTGLRVENRTFLNSGECVDAVASGDVDVGFAPVDEERRRRVAVGPAYYLIESTYLAAPGIGVSDISEVDRPGVRVVGIANTTTIRAAARTLTATVPSPVRSVEDAIEMMKTGRADVLALSRDSLKDLRQRVPGSRIVTGRFQLTTISVLTGKDRPRALAYLTSFMEIAKATGVVRRAFDDVGQADEPVAPPETPR